MSKRFLFLIVAAILVSQPLIASTPDAVPHSKFLQGGFVDVGAGFADLSDVDAEWGDYDHDGDPDLLLWGRVEAEHMRRTVIYRNDAGVFVDIGADLLGMSKSDGTSIWIDYDADGDLDVLQSGFSPDATPLPYATRIYRNDGADTFVEAATDLPALGFSSAGWGDYDGDGDPDLLLTGSPIYGGDSPAAIYRNDGDGAFTDIGADVADDHGFDLGWIDYDSDGDLDAWCAGGTSGIHLYRNDGGAFTHLDLGAVGIAGAAAWADYDGDGDPDLLVTGYTSLTSTMTRLYRNDAGNLMEVATAIPDIGTADCAWGDYDADGDPDLLVCGAVAPDFTARSRVWRNDAGVFAGGRRRSVRSVHHCVVLLRLRRRRRPGHPPLRIHLTGRTRCSTAATATLRTRRPRRRPD